MFPRNYPALPFCFVLEGCRLADAREGGGGGRGHRVGVGGPSVSDLRDDGTGSRPVCVWGGGGEQGVSALRLECEAGELGSQSLRLLRVSSLLGSGEDVEERGGPGNYPLHPRGL